VTDRRTDGRTDGQKAEARTRYAVYYVARKNGSPYAIRQLSVLSCLYVSLSVTLVYCSQTVRWIKIKPGLQVGLGPDHIVLDGDPAPLPKAAQPRP